MTTKTTQKPNLFLVGAAKAGTTSLAAYLGSHTEIYLSPIKEPNHFNTEVDLGLIREDHRRNTYIDFNSYFSKSKLENIHIAFVQHRENYLNLFREVEQQRYLMEASTGYLYSPVAAQNIHAFNSEAKIIIILRHPVERAISHYMMDAARGNVKLEKSLNTIRDDHNATKQGYCITNLYIELSLYYAQVRRFLDTFQPENVLVLNFDTLRKSPTLVLQQVASFLELRYDFAEENKVLNQTGASRFGSVRKHFRGVKHLLPHFLVQSVKNVDNILAKPLDKQQLQPGTEDYIKNMVMQDWENLTKELKF